MTGGPGEDKWCQRRSDKFRYQHTEGEEVNTYVEVSPAALKRRGWWQTLRYRYGDIDGATPPCVDDVGAGRFCTYQRALWVGVWSSVVVGRRNASMGATT